MTIQVHKQFIKKRTGQVVVHDHSKIISAIFRAQQSLGKGNEKLAAEIAQEVEDRLFKEFFSCNKIPEVENVQDFVEEALMKWNLFDVAKAFIVYRAERSRIRDQQNVVLDVKKTIDQYLGLEEGHRKDWRVKENANQDFDYPGLNIYISGTHLAQYGLYTLYPPEVAEAHVRGHIHIHDLSNSIVGYSFYGKNMITIKKNEKIRCFSLEGLFKNTESPISVLNGFEVKNLENTYVLDVNGSWTKLKRIVRHEKGEDLVEAQTENGNSVIVTKDHPYFTVGRNNVDCPKCGFINESVFRTNDDTRRYKCSECGKSYLIEMQPKKPIEKVVYTKDINRHYSINNLTKLEGVEEKNGYLLGLYLADGYFKQQNEKIFGVGIASKNEEFKKYVIQALPHLNLRIYESEIAYNKTDYVNDVVIHFGRGSDNKLIPFIYSDLTMGDILSGIVDGDGTVRVSDNRIRVTIRISSYSLLQQLHEWLTKCHVKSSLMSIDMAGEKKHKNFEFKTIKPMFSLNFTVTEKLFELMKLCYKFKNLQGNYGFRKEIVYKKYPISHLRKFKNKEKYVYDIETESNSFLVDGIKVHNCAGWSLQLLLEKGFGGVRGRISSRPAGHLDSAINQMITFLGTLQNEFAGAQAFSVHPKETVIIKNKSEQISIARIGDFCDQFITKFGKTEKGLELADLSNLGFKSLSFDKDGNHCWKKIKKVIRHKITDPIHILTTNKGTINVSKNHSLFSLKNHNYLGGLESKVFDVLNERKKLHSDRLEEYLDIKPNLFIRTLQNLKIKGLVKNSIIRRDDGTVSHSIYRPSFNNNFVLHKTAELSCSKEVKSKDVRSNVAVLSRCTLKQKINFDLYNYLLNHERLSKITRVYSTFEELKAKIQNNSSLRQESLKISNNEKYLSYLFSKGYLPLKLYDKYRNRYHLNNKDIKLGKIRKTDYYNEILSNKELILLLKMIAWYLTEGWAIGDHAIGFSQTRKKYLEDIGTSLRDLNCPFHIREREKGKQEYIIGGFLGTFINNTCGKYCDDKKIPEFIFDLSNNLKNVFINEIIKGDGYKRSTGWVYTSTSNVLITGLNLMLISLGYRTSIRTRFDKNFENHKCGSSTRDKAKLTRYDLIIHENEEKILNFNDFESAVIFKNCQHHFNSQYEYDLSIEGSEAFIGGVGLFALHNSSVDTLLAPFIREKFEKSVEKILRQIFSLKVNGQGYELLDLLYAYRKGEIQASDICAKLESFYLNIIFRDDLIQTFLRSFNEEYEDNVSFIRQNIQNLIYALNQTSRWGGQCVSEDTQCLTDTGWKYYNELDSENDKIATFNGITHKIEYLNPQKINIFDYDGDLISIKNRSQDQLLTPNHRVVRKVFNADKYILESAENLFKYKTRIQIPNSAPTYSNFEIEDHLVELLAWLVSEGGFSTGPRKRVHLYQSVKNQECVDLIRKCLTANKFKWDEQKRIHGYGKHELIRFRLNQESSRKIREIINSKQIPEFIRNLSRRQIKLFLDTYIKGDGHVEKKGRIRFYTKDESVKDSLQELCVLAGYGSTVHQQVNKVFSINLIRNSITNITQISKIPYKGKVWCPTTLNGTFVARRMDKTFITGNSPFVNLSFDWKVPSDLADQAAIIRGQPHESILYRDCQTEMDIFNRVFMEEMHQGDKHNRVFTFPIPTYSITKDFDWNHPNVDLLMQITARYGIPYFQNYCLVKETKIIGRDLKGRIRKTDLKSLREDWSILTPDGFKKVLKKYTVRYDNYPISITFSNGENISCSENHLFPTSTGLKKAKDLEKDDFVLVGERAYDENTRGGNYSYGRFLGLYLGDGYIEKGKTRINFPNKDKTIIDFVNKFSKKAFMSTNTLNQRKDGLYNLYINSRAAVSYIFDFTLGSNAKTKRLRSSIFDTSREFREGLIKGYHEADGNKSKHNRFEVSSTSHQLIKDMRSILISLGKRTTRRRKCIEAKGNDRKYLYTLTEASENVQQSRIFKEINGNTYCKVVKIGRSKSFSKELIDIQIEGEDKLFTLACGVVTHNSGTGLEPSSIRAMCCRLNLNLLELKNRPGGMWSIGDSTGSIGVVTINLNRLGYLAVDKDDFFRLLRKYMDLAKMSLEIKRKEITRNLEKGMMAFATNYLPHGFQTYFSTIGLCGMHECCLNFLKRGIDTPEGLKFAEKILRFMRNICEEYKKETGNLYNLEATPAESTSYRFARLDKKWYPTIITSGNANGYFLTNSTHLPVDATTDLIKAIEHQNVLQPLYSGGTIFHTFLGEEIDPEACKNIVRQISEKTQLPYFSITPTFSICTEHRYIKGKHFTCPHCGKPTEVYSRIVGYFRPVSKWNDGKTQEFKERVMFELHDFDKIREIQMTEIREAKTSYIPELNADSAIQSEVVNENTSNGNYIAVFVSPTCPKCGPFKRLLHQLVDTIEIRTIDTSTEEGLRLVREFGILQLPTAIVFTEEGNTFRFSTIEELNEYLPILQNL